MLSKKEIVGILQPMIEKFDLLTISEDDHYARFDRITNAEGVDIGQVTRSICIDSTFVTIIFRLASIQATSTIGVDDEWITSSDTLEHIYRMKRDRLFPDRLLECAERVLNHA